MVLLGGGITFKEFIIIVTVTGVRIIVAKVSLSSFEKV